MFQDDVRRWQRLAEASADEEESSCSCSSNSWLQTHSVRPYEASTIILPSQVYAITPGDGRGQRDMERDE